MRNSRQIGLLFWGLIYLSFTPNLLAQSAQIDKSPNLNQLEASFQATPFSPQQFEAFSARGEQKFRDFLDYVSFLTSEDVEALWKAHIVEQVNALFIHDSVSCLDTESLIEFLKAPRIIAGNESVLEMELIQDFEKRGDDFVAVLETKISYKNGKSEKILADLHLLKREKAFGEESIAVWEVLLGNVKRN